METTTMGVYRVQGLGLYWDSGKANGNYCSLMGYISGLYFGIMEKKRESTIDYMYTLYRKYYPPVYSIWCLHEKCMHIRM